MFNAKPFLTKTFLTKALLFGKSTFSVFCAPA